MRNSSKVFKLFAAAALFLFASVAGAQPPLKAGDRVVFLGDSITQQQIYTRYVMNYFTLRYPGLDVTFRNAGWGGDFASRGLGRLQRDVLSLKPTVVTVCYGMNDAGYKKFDEKVLGRYAQSMEGLVAELKKAGARVVLLTPGCVDTDRNAPFKEVDYNGTLARYGQAVEQLARKENAAFFNMHGLMLDAQTRAKARDPNFTMLPDGVHPNEMGQAVMTYAALKALGCKDQASGLEIDALASKAIADRCRVEDLKVTADSVTFTRTDEALPTALDTGALPILDLVPFTQDFNQYTFKVTGLKAGSWKLTVEGIEVGAFSDKDFAAGVNLATLPGPWLKIGQEVNNACKEQESLYFTAWREVSLLKVPEEANPERDALASKLGEFVLQKEAARLKTVPSNRSWKWVVTLVK